jgi:hypothetical protein
MGTWKTFWQWKADDRRAVLSAFCVMVASRVGLRVAGYGRWISFLSRWPRARAGLALVHETLPKRLALLARAAARNLPFQPTCLERSVGLWWLLRRRGLGAEIRIGARKTGDRFEAHAWVECAGLVLNDAGEEHRRFSVFSDSGPIRARELR